MRGRYVQDVDTDGPGSVTDVRWDVNTGTRCVQSWQCVCLHRDPIYRAQAVELVESSRIVERKTAEMSNQDAWYRYV